MRQFKDGTGRPWCISINVAAVKRVKGLVGVDIPGLVDNGLEGLGKLLGDFCGLVDVLYCLAKDDADRLGVSDEDFGRAMYGDALSQASDAFVAELIDFFPDPRVRTALANLMATSRKVTDQILARATEEIATFDLEALANRSMKLSGNSPASRASTPRRSRSAS